FFFFFFDCCFLLKMSTGRPVFRKPPGTTGSLDAAAWKLLILNLEDVNARIYGRFSLFLISAV
ncbi:hypothetical protein K794_22671, partial [Salmonella enterica subsp. enterica serovar Newport str. SHSN004]|uniref:hypothetical protein n=1 Tax=Salmonella enterica TaxID=28901 RepID=UPI000A183DFD